MRTCVAGPAVCETRIELLEYCRRSCPREQYNDISIMPPYHYSPAHLPAKGRLPKHEEKFDRTFHEGVKCFLFTAHPRSSLPAHMDKYDEISNKVTRHWDCVQTRMVTKSSCQILHGDSISNTKYNTHLVSNCRVNPTIARNIVNVEPFAGTPVFFKFWGDET